MRSRSAVALMAAAVAMSLPVAQAVAQERPPSPPTPAPPAPAPAPPVPAKAPPPPTVVRGSPVAISLSGVMSSNRAVMGVTLGAAGAGDSAGVLVERVTENGPAQEAGIAEGDRIIAVDGQDIRLTRGEAADDAQHGLAVRRLRRALGELEPGDELRLRVRGAGGERNVTLNVVSAADLARTTVRMMPGESGRMIFRSGNRPAVGLTTQATGTPRDTLGVFVRAVAPDGPAERAGIYEGDRIVSVGGTDLRVRPVDASDRYVAQLKATALTEAIRESTVGEPLEMRVWRAGQVRAVRVTPQPSSEVSGASMFESLAPAFNIETLRSVPGFRVDTSGSGFTIFRSNMNDVELHSQLEALHEELDEFRSRAMESQSRADEVRSRLQEAQVRIQGAQDRARAAQVRAAEVQAQVRSRAVQERVQEARMRAIQLEQRTEAAREAREVRLREAQDRLREELIRRRLEVQRLNRLV